MSVKREEVQRVIKCPEWQKLRTSLKGRPTIIKLEVCKDYLSPQAWNNSHFRVRKDCCLYVDRCIQVLNYVTALSRGGLISPLPRAWQWSEHIEQWLREKRYNIKGEG